MSGGYWKGDLTGSRADWPQGSPASSRGADGWLADEAAGPLQHVVHVVQHELLDLPGEGQDAGIRLGGVFANGGMDDRGGTIIKCVGDHDKAPFFENRE